MTRIRATKFVDVNGGRIAYDESGAGPAVVFVHEAIADRRMWDRDFDRLATSHHVIRYDQRGFGKSPEAKSNFSPVQDLRWVLEKAGTTRTAIIGASMGGRLAIEFAVNYPGLTSGLLLIAPGPPSGLDTTMLPEAAKEFEDDERVSKAMAQAWSDKRVDDAIELVRQRWCSALQGSALELFRRMVRANGPEIFEERSFRFARDEPEPAVPRLSAIRVPVEIVLGDRDAPLQKHFVNFVAKRIPNSHIEIVPGGDHMPNLSRPEAFDLIVDKFLSRPGIVR
ncbi:MAG TPA: alpha/beta hydrolase [Thermoplasmata archaeon]|nr:alpha/beta hydrolase [Thermoplasmata archaeon]